MSSQPADSATLGYEQARDQLVDVVRRLEAGAATLEESLSLWERGEALAARCEAWLAGARQRIEGRAPTTGALVDDGDGRSGRSDGAGAGGGPAADAGDDGDDLDELDEDDLGGDEDDLEDDLEDDGDDEPGD